jgi:predicted DNA-binding protein (UPF0251 family)
MPRPIKCRKVCCLPITNMFGPVTGHQAPETVINMTVEEYETIRLIDFQNYNQEECGKYMSVARTTVQNIYNNARYKIAKALVEGKCLVIEGGNYTLCDGRDKRCGHSCCYKHRFGPQC